MVKRSARSPLSDPFGRLYQGFQGFAKLLEHAASPGAALFADVNDRQADLLEAAFMLRHEVGSHLAACMQGEGARAANRLASRMESTPLRELAEEPWQTVRMRASTLAQRLGFGASDSGIAAWAADALAEVGCARAEGPQPHTDRATSPPPTLAPGARRALEYLEEHGATLQRDLEAEGISADTLNRLCGQHAGLLACEETRGRANGREQVRRLKRWGIASADEFARLMGRALRPPANALE